MKAVVKTADGLDIRTVPVPRPKPEEVLVKVRNASLNRADLFLLQGRAHGQHGGEGTVLGLEWSGEIVAAGSLVTGFKVGDRVMCSGIGGFAEYAVADHRRVFPLPPAIKDYATGACLSVALRTSHTAIKALGQLLPGQSVVVLGASSGVGLMCLQVARALGAGLVIGTSTNVQRRLKLRDYGADAVLDTSKANWVDEIMDCTFGKGADLLIDFLAGPLVNDSMRAVKVGGRIVNVGRMAGESGHFDFDLHSLRQIQYLGQTFRTRSIEEIAAIGVQVQADLWPALERGELSLPIDSVLPLARIDEAFRQMESNAHFGKIVIEMAG